MTDNSAKMEVEGKVTEHSFSVTHSLQEYAGVVVIGVIFGLVMPLVAHFNGHGNDALKDLVRHLIRIDKEAIGFAGALGGVAMTFSGSKTARIVVSQICASFLGIVAHASVLAVGVMLGLLVPIGLQANDLPTYSVRTVFVTAMSAAILFFVIYFFYLLCKGYFSSLTKKVSKYTSVCVISGLIVFSLSIVFLFDLKFSGWS